MGELPWPIGTMDKPNGGKLLTLGSLMVAEGACS